jgi:5'-deoxynucleotidase
VNLSNILELQSRLSAIQRYSQIRLVNPESVLEHTGFVALTCYIFGVILQTEGHQIDQAHLMGRALIHDIEEVITGDIPRPTKYSTHEIRKVFEGLASASIMKVLDDLEVHKGVTRRISYDWHNAKSGREGLIVAIADRLAVVYKVWQEYTMSGNVAIKDNLFKSGSGMRDQLERLKKEFPGTSIIGVVQEAIGMCSRIKGDTN